MSKPPIVRILDRTGQAADGQTLPAVGRAIEDESLPVVLAKGIPVNQSFIPIPAFNRNSSDTVAATIVLVVAENADRRYLKIVNNGSYKVELWNEGAPDPSAVGGDIPKGEVLYDTGDGIVESDTCRTNAIYATCFGGTTGLMVLEG